MSTTVQREPERRAGWAPAGRRVPRWQLLLRYLLLLAVLALTIGPFLWQLSTSLKGPGEDLYHYPPSLLPQHVTLDNYAGVAGTIPVWDFALNSSRWRSPMCSPTARARHSRVTRWPGCASRAVGVRWSYSSWRCWCRSRAS